MVFTWVCNPDIIYKDAASILIIVTSSTVNFYMSLKMERERRLVLLDCLMAIQHNQMQMNILKAKMQAILDRRKERTCWVRHWIATFDRFPKHPNYFTQTDGHPQWWAVA